MPPDVLRVAIDARDAADPRTGGWGRYARFLIEALGGVEGIELILYERSPPVPELAFEQLLLPRMLRRDRPDVVHTPNCFLPLRRPCAGVVTIHDLAFEAFPEDFTRVTGWKYRTFAPRAARSAERVIVPSEATRSDLLARYDVSPARVRVVPEGPALPPPGRGATEGSGEPARPGYGSPAGAAGRTPYILYVGALREKKNVRRLLEAFAAARAGGLEQELVLAGPGEPPSRPQGARFLGFVGDEELDRLYRGADLLVYPSLYEGFGLAALEAMARGCPVALSHATSLPEVGGDAAEYFDPASADDIAAAMLRLGRDPERRAELARAGLERARTLTWERAAGETAGVYREAVEERRG